MARRGRRPKDAGSRKSVALSVRVTPSLHAQLDKACARAGRTISQEIEIRLRSSFDRAEFGGPTNYWLFRLIARGIGEIEGKSGHRWFADRYTFDECRELLVEAWDRCRPRGRKRAPNALKDEQSLGRRIAMSVLAQLQRQLEGWDLGADTWNAAGYVGTKIKNPPLPEIRAAAERQVRWMQRHLREFPDLPSEKRLTLDERIERVIARMARKESPK